ncbi:MAG TPA: FGGY-family carbohydrate kinase [Acidimicrobiia bacterium]|nr:FGGY-family carbohydrate kinase [Acidimicrobiia bacterium]
MTRRSRVLAVDLGATSVRVAAVDLDAAAPSVEILHRWHNSPREEEDGSLRWDWPGIVEHVEKGLALGIAAGPVASIGVDGWGVDYALIDAQGALVELPIAYRDNRTDGWETIADRIGVERLYQITGIQLMGINTIFQLAVESTDRLARAEKLLLLPDLMVNHLTGWVGVERSNLSTTGLMDALNGGWSDELLGEIGVARSLMPEPADAGEKAGEWRGVPVHLVGSHDTASAFLGMPGANSRSVFVSTGSWVIVGIERPAPDMSREARAANFSNEAGALGGVRFLKNVVGFWILEQCRSAWGDPPTSDLIAEAASVDARVPTFDASDHRFVNTDDMVSEVRDAAGLALDVPRPVIVRSVIESIVAGVARVIDEIEIAVGERPSSLALVGGGSRIPLLAELLGAKTNLDVIVGSPEATALGNAIVQGISLGRFEGLATARDWLSSSGVAAWGQR